MPHSQVVNILAVHNIITNSSATYMHVIIMFHQQYWRSIGLQPSTMKQHVIYSLILQSEASDYNI